MLHAAVWRPRYHTHVADLASMFVLQTVDPDTCIYEEGDKPEAVYILLNGSIEVSKDGQELAILDGAVGDSDESGHPYFGAEAVLEGRARDDRGTPSHARRAI